MHPHCDRQVVGGDGLGRIGRDAEIGDHLPHRLGQLSDFIGCPDIDLLIDVAQRDSGGRKLRSVDALGDPKGDEQRQPKLSARPTSRTRTVRNRDWPNVAVIACCCASAPLLAESMRVEMGAIIFVRIGTAVAMSAAALSSRPAFDSTRMASIMVLYVAA